MAQIFQAVPVSEHVHWVGAVDWAVRDFHGYLTSRGTTYNAYLVTGEKTVLIDTVKAPFQEECLARIASVVDPSQVDVIISNHSEMDHSGSLPSMIHRLQPEKVYASANGAKALFAHFHMDGGIDVVKDGQSLPIGDRNFAFVETRMLHWPDSMVTYLAEDKILFSQDAFGMHLATSERFADQIPREILRWEAAKYFANILMPLSKLILKLLDRVPTLNLDIQIIAPDHGPIWREDVAWPLERYAEWSRQEPTNKAVVVYDTMWQSTGRMARSIADGLAGAGATVKVMELGPAHRSDVATELLDAGALLVGSPTINNGMFPTVADVMCYIRGLKPQNLVGASFGSYGWSGEAVGLLQEILDEMKVERVHEGLKVKYVPDEQALQSCVELGKTVASRLPIGQSA